MLAFTVLVSLLPLALGLPTSVSQPISKRDSGSLECVQQQYQGPFTSFGQRGLIHLYSNITNYDPSTETTSFVEQRLGLINGTIQPCGDCRTIELFGFEVCQDRTTRNGFNGLGNSATDYYGHITYYNYGLFQCLQVSQTPINGSSLILADCEYDYENAAASGQYFQLASSTGNTVTRLVGPDNDTYGPNGNVTTGSPLVLTNETTPFTYFGFHAPVF